MSPHFEFGRFLKPQGVRGQVKAELYTNEPWRAADLDHFWTGEPGHLTERRILGARVDGKFAYFDIEGITDRDAAEKLRDQAIYIERAQAAPLPEGAFYISDLLDLPVTTDKEEQLGTLRDVLQTGATDIYVVARPDGTDFLFPAVEDVFVERDPEEGRIILDSKRLSEVSEYDV